jgi:serine/threonine-protein kinase
VEPRVSEPDDLVGRVLLGKLHVIGVLGRGGMGAVYEVEHRLTRHRRALKVLHSRLEDSEHAVKRFLREATVAGTLKSPHVVEIYDAGQLESGAPYVLMEKLEGRTLGELLEGRTRMEAGKIARVVWEAAQGIAAAHRAGIVHRDLKPDNLFVANERDGSTRVKILDFGISKFAPDAYDGELTGEGTVMGTPYYMAPEQAESAKDADGRADIYALGVILYEAVSGRRPFDDESFAALVVKIHRGECEPLGKLVPALDPAFVEVVQRAMHRDPAQRYPTIEAFAGALAPFAEGPLAAVDRSARDASVAPTPDSVREAREKLRAQGRVPLYAAAAVLGLLGIGAVATAFAIAWSEPDRDELPTAVGRELRRDAGALDAGAAEVVANVETPMDEPIDEPVMEEPVVRTAMTKRNGRLTVESAMLETDPWGPE